jgi:hypothetical protein
LPHPLSTACRFEPVVDSLGRHESNYTVAQFWAVSAGTNVRKLAQFVSKLRRIRNWIVGLTAII